METKRRAAPQSGHGGLSHADRDACLHLLGELHASGHLTFPQLETRIQEALAAETADELAGLVRDRPDNETGSRSSFGGEAEATTEPRSARTASAVIAKIAVGVVVKLGAAVVSLGAALLTGALAVVQWTYGGLRAILHASSAAVAALRRPKTPVEPPAEPRETPPQELAVAPRPQVPMQRQPIKVYAVRVPVSEEPSPSPAAAPVPELPSGVRPALPPGRVAPRGELVVASDSPVAATPRGEAVRQVVAQLRPLFDRVTHRVHVRRSSIVRRQETHLSDRRSRRSN